MGDFSTVSDKALEPQTVPSGLYDAVIKSVEEKENEERIQEDGHSYPYLNFSFKLTDPELEDIPPVYYIQSFAPKAVNGTFRFITMLLGEAPPRGEFDVTEYEDQLVGLRVKVQIKPGEWQGVPRNNVTRVSRPRSGLPIAAPSGKRLGF